MDWSNKELIKEAWQKIKSNLWTILAIELLIYLFNYLGREAGVDFIASLLSSFVFASVLIRLSRGKSVNLSNLFDGLSGAKLLHYLAAMIIVTVLVGIGLFLLVVPGIILALMFCFASYIVIDLEQNEANSKFAFWEAIKKSIRITKGSKWKLFYFFLWALLINIIGFFALVVGLLITLPLTGVAFAGLYDRFKNTETKPLGNVADPHPSVIAN